MYSVMQRVLITTLVLVITIAQFKRKHILTVTRQATNTIDIPMCAHEVMINHKNANSVASQKLKIILYRDIKLLTIITMTTITIGMNHLNTILRTFTLMRLTLSRHMISSTQIQMIPVLS